MQIECVCFKIANQVYSYSASVINVVNILALRRLGVHCRKCFLVAECKILIENCLFGVPIEVILKLNYMAFFACIFSFLDLLGSATSFEVLL